MTKSQRIEPENLAQLEAEWDRLLPQCLEECAGGRWGLFASSPVVAAYVDWPEAARLWSLAKEIRSIRATRGSVNPECERFLHYCSLPGANIRRDPKLAREFLNHLKQNSEQKDKKE